jgi:hypothetical protein
MVLPWQPLLKTTDAAPVPYVCRLVQMDSYLSEGVWLRTYVGVILRTLQVLQLGNKGIEDSIWCLYAWTIYRKYYWGTYARACCAFTVPELPVTRGSTTKTVAAKSCWSNGPR